MAVTVVTSGTQTVTGTNATYGLVSATAQGVYQFVMSMKNMKGSATADWVEIEVIGHITSTATDEIIDIYTLLGAQGQDFFRTQPYVSPHYIAVNFRHKTFCSTGTDFLWALYSVT